MRHWILCVTFGLVLSGCYNAERERELFTISQNVERHFRPLPESMRYCEMFTRWQQMDADLRALAANGATWEDLGSLRVSREESLQRRHELSRRLSREAWRLLQVRLGYDPSPEWGPYWTRTISIGPCADVGPWWACMNLQLWGILNETISEFGRDAALRDLGVTEDALHDQLVVALQEEAWLANDLAKRGDRWSQTLGHDLLITLGSSPPVAPEEIGLTTDHVRELSSGLVASPHR